MDDRTWLGALAESKVRAALVQEQWWVFTEVSGKAPFDMIAVKGRLLHRVEVKGCATRRPNGGFAVGLRSTRPNRTGYAVHSLSAATSDLVAVYLEPIDAVCFFATTELAGRRSITLHEDPSSRDRRRNVIRDYATLPDGAVAEWTKASVLNTEDPQGSVGSNPTRSA